MAYLTIDGKLLLYNGKYVTVESSGTTGESQVITVKPTKSQQVVTPDYGCYLSSVTVEAIPSDYIIPSGTLPISYNAEFDVKNYEKVSVNVTLNLQHITVTPTKSQQVITPDAGYEGFYKVTVAAIPDEYISTSDATATPSDIASGKTAYVGGQKITGTASSGSNITCSFESTTGTLTITEN